MSQAHGEMLQTVVSESNLGDYTEARSRFDWESVERHFTWHASGKVNMAHEAIDRHVLEGRGGKPLYCIAMLHVKSPILSLI